MLTNKVKKQLGFMTKLHLDGADAMMQEIKDMQVKEVENKMAHG